MKSYYIKFLIALLLIGGLSGCASVQKMETGDGIVISTSGYPGQLMNEGRLYFDFGKSLLTFYDFQTNTNLPVCSRPNCTHNSTECAAFFDGNSIDGYAIYKNALYLFIPESGTDYYTNLFKADMDGSNRQKIASIKGSISGSIIFADDKIFFAQFIQEQAPVLDTVSSSDIVSIWSISCFDLGTGKETSLVADFKTLYGQLHVWNYYDGKLYYTINCLKDGFDEATYELSKQDSDDWETRCYVYDILAGQEKELLPDALPLDFSGRLILYQTKNEDSYKIYIMNVETGVSDNVIGFDIDKSIYLLDNKLFWGEPTGYGCIYKQVYYDLNTKETKEVATSLLKNEMLTITDEIGDKFFGYLARYTDDGITQVGNSIYCYMLKKDYYNGMKDYVEISDMG